MISLVIPSGGLFRHNQNIWRQLAGCQSAGLGLEVITVHRAHLSGELVTFQTSVGLTATHAVYNGSNWTVPAAYNFGAQFATLKNLAFAHDDIVFATPARTLARMTQFDVCAPRVYSLAPDGGVAPNPDSEYLNRCILGITRDVFSFLGGFDPDYRLLFYEQELQTRAMDAGINVYEIADSAVLHDESATLREVIGAGQMLQYAMADEERWNGAQGQGVNS